MGRGYEEPFLSTFTLRPEKGFAVLLSFTLAGWGAGRLCPPVELKHGDLDWAITTSTILIDSGLN